MIKTYSSINVKELNKQLREDMRLDPISYKVVTDVIDTGRGQSVVITVVVEYEHKVEFPL